MCQPGSSRNNRPTHRGWLGGEVACSEINSTLRCGSDGNCAFERAARASIAHAVSNTILRRRKRSIVTWTRAQSFGRRLGLWKMRTHKSVRTSVLRGRTLEHQDLCGKYVHCLPVLIQCSASYFDDALVRFRARGRYFENLALHLQSVARAGWLRPCELSTQADDAIG